MQLKCRPSRRFGEATLLSRHAVCASLALSMLALAPRPVWAQTIPPGGNLFGVPVTNSTVLTLQGGAILSDGASASATKTLPTGSPGLTINGAAGGSTITLNDGAGHFAHFTSTVPVILNLSGVTLTGGNATGLFNNGGFYQSQASSLTINGDLIANLNQAENSGGVIFTGGTTTVTGGVLLNGNTAAFSGGAIQALAGLSLAATSGNVTVTNNMVTGVGAGSGGGALLSQGTTVVGNSAGTVTFTGNRSGENGGAINSTNRLTLNGTSIIFTDNHTVNRGGAINVITQDVVVNGPLTANSNTAAVGGVIYSSAGVSASGAVTMDGNAALGGGTDPNTGRGGAVFTGGNLAFATTSGNASLTNNVALNSGGAIFAGQGSSAVSIGNSAGLVDIEHNWAGYAPGTPPTPQNTTAQGGAINVARTATLTGTVTLADNHATSSGGAVFSLLGNAVVNGDLTATANISGSAGGAFSTVTGLSVSGNTTATGNVATGQGGFASVTGGNVALATTTGNVSLTNNTAGTSGGAIFAAGAGFGNVAAGNASSTVTITGNKAGFNAAGTAINNSSNGGAIDSSSGGTTLTGTAITLSNNTATASGGGIFAGLASTVNGNLTATNNLAQNGSGGAINVQAGGLTVNGTLTANGNRTNNVFPNTVTKGGGAIFVGAGDVTVTGETSMDANITTAVNTATGVGVGPGGAILAANGNVHLATTGGNVSLTNNIASSSGGAIFAAGSGNGNVSLGTTGSTLTITGNRAGFTPGGTQVPGSSSGGAISNTVGTTTLTGGTITMSNNAATANGGAVASLGVVAVGNVTATANFLTGGSGGVINAGTGGVAVTGTLTANNNRAVTGGGVISSVGSVLVTDSVNLDANFAGTGPGGAINTTTGTVSLTATGNASLTNNIAGGSGGAINSAGGTTVGNSTGTTLITGNKAGFNNAGTAINTVSDGGAINSLGPTALAGSSIELSNNVATRSGGGIFSAQALDVVGNLTATNNNAANGSGGAVNVQAGALTVTGNVTATGNTAALDGGAIYSIPAVTVNGDLTASNNTAQANGGAIFAGNGITVTGNTSLSANSAPNGGGAILAAGGDVNLATMTGDVSLLGNTTTGDGGAIQTNQGSVTLGSGNGAVTITDNQAGGNGGAISSALDFTLNAGSASTISGNAADGFGGALWVGNNATLNALGGDITFTGNTQTTGSGAQANAIYLNGGAASTTTFNALAGRIITFFDPITSNAANGPVSVLKTGDGLVSFDGSQHSALADRTSTIYANTQVLAGTFEVANDAVYGVHAAAVGGTADSTFTTAAGTTLQGGVLGTVIADQFTLGGDLSIAGRQPATRGVFTIDSNNVMFGPGSQILFNTLLNDGVVQDTDLLVLNLNGTATSGQASILVTNVGGLGALTVGDGIKLVQTNNGTTAGAFVLGNRVAAGAFEYDLFYGGNPATGGDPNDQNWYLRNEPAPRPEVPTVTVLPALANRLGLRLLGTYHERYGGEFPVLDCGDQARVDRITPVADVVTPCAEERRTAMWGRVFGETGETDFGDSMDDFSDHGPGYDFDMEGLQAGLDILNVRHEDDTRDFAGFSVGFASSGADVNDATGGFAGTSDLDVYSLGGYWTHFGAAGWYVDAVLQGLIYDNGEAKSSAGESFGTDGWGMTASLEAGYPFALGDDWTLEPQAQLVYQHVSLDDGEDQFGQIELDDTDVVYGRLGGRLVRYWATADDLRVSTWLLANVWSDFGEQAETTFATFAGDFATSFDTDLGGTWGSFGLGLTGQVSDNMQLFASGEYNTGLDDGDFWSVSGRAGLKIVW